MFPTLITIRDLDGVPYSMRFEGIDCILPCYENCVATKKTRIYMRTADNDLVINKPVEDVIQEITDLANTRFVNNKRDVVMTPNKLIDTKILDNAYTDELMDYTTDKKVVILNDTLMFGSFGMVEASFDLTKLVKVIRYKNADPNQERCSVVFSDSPAQHEVPVDATEFLKMLKRYHMAKGVSSDTMLKRYHMAKGVSSDTECVEQGVEDDARKCSMTDTFFAEQ